LVAVFVKAVNVNINSGTANSRLKERLKIGRY
jgi:hypothetical protein